MIRFSKKDFEYYGISRISNITGLDILDIPVWTVFRADIDLYERNNISVYNGKGLFHKYARYGAIMEAVERYSAEPCREKHLVIEATENELVESNKKFISPKDLLYPDCFHYTKRSPIEWVAGQSLFSNKKILVPAYSVFSPYTPPAHLKFMKYWDTNGLAAGQTIEGALVSAFMEIIERDAVSIAEVKGASRSVDEYLLKDKKIRKLIDKYNAAGINLVLKQVDSDVGIPVFVASSDDPHGYNCNLLTRGQAAWFTPEVALQKAILEAAQSRVAIIQGAREDLYQYSVGDIKKYERMKKYDFEFYFTEGSNESIDTIDRSEMSIESSSSSDQLKYLLSLIKDAGFDQAVYVDFTDQKHAIPVVKVVIPGMENYRIPELAGKRLKRIVCG